MAEPLMETVSPLNVDRGPAGVDQVVSRETPPQTSDGAASLPRQLRREWLWGLLLVVAVFLAYQPVWKAGFIWDDDDHLTANPVVVGPLGLKEIWTTRAARICPLVFTTFWFEHALWGLHPLPYHLVNVLLQGASGVVLWRVLHNLRVPGAWLGAALWALHPVQVETVAWITELKNTQSGLFYLLSVLFFVKSLREVGEPRGGQWQYALAMLFAAMAMASKSSTVVLPVVLCLCAWWVERRWRWRNLLRVTPPVLMAIAAAALSMWTQSLEGAGNALWARSWPERLVTTGDAVWFYLGKLLWPHPLIFIYPRWVIHTNQWHSYLPLAALMVVLLILWRKRASWGRPCFFALAYFVVALLPVIGLVSHYFLRYSFVGDHFQYLASMGPLALAGAGLARASASLGKAKPFFQPAAAGSILLVMSVLTWGQCPMYADNETLWRATIARNPQSWMAHTNLGCALRLSGRTPQAMEQFTLAIRLNPHDSAAHDNLGSLLLREGQVDPAIAQFRAAMADEPNSASIHDSLGTALLRGGQVYEAIEQFRKVIKINPNHAPAHFSLGNALLSTGQQAEAIDQFQAVIRIQPNYADAHNNMASALLDLGHKEEAKAEFERALQINPNEQSAKKALKFLSTNPAPESPSSPTPPKN
jgi:tetratricopeptide (TPR) repeat protein